METLPRKKQSYGCAHVIRGASEKMRQAQIKSVNLALPFEEALKLNMALQAAVMDMNSYDRSSKSGKNKAVNICYFSETDQITVTLTNVSQKGE